MSKSKGNQFTLRNLLDQGHAPETIRYLLLSVNYRRQLNFGMDGLHQAQASLQRLEDFILRMKEKESEQEPCPGFAEEVRQARESFVDTMDDDLNTSAALAVIFEFVRSTYQKNDQGEISGGDARAARRLLEEFDQVFAVLRPQPELLDEEILKQIEERIEARRRRDFAEADRIRDWLLSKGIQLEDTRDGTRWKRSH